MYPIIIAVLKDLLLLLCIPLAAELIFYVVSAKESLHGPADEMDWNAEPQLKKN
jgi:hypothetical protein